MQAAKNNTEELISSPNKSKPLQESSSTERKQGRKITANLFKKKNEGKEDLQKRCWSSEGMKLIKRTSAEDRTHKKEPIYREEAGNEAIRTSPNLTESQNLPSGSSRPPSSPSAGNLVFNKFTSQQRIKIQQYLLLLKDQTAESVHSEAMAYIINKIRIYIEQLEDNNSKLLQVNFFFQKEFSRAKTDKTKTVQKCTKDYCLECRYHLEKENRWKQEKNEMTSQLQRLQSQMSSVRLSQSSNPNASLTFDDQKDNISTTAAMETMKSQLQQLKAKLVQKDEEYLVLVKEFNYLDSLNKDLTNRLSKVIEEYKYLSIQNRTLLNLKSKLLEKELECSKVKNERDQFKKKLIEFHKKMQPSEEESEEDELCQKCRGGGSTLSREESVFTLSSLSTDRQRSEINQTQV